MRSRTLVLWILIILVYVSLAQASDDSYKPYLHKASVPESPKIRLFGQYATSLFPGSATYSYGIEMPKGTVGLDPSLSLSYNSQAVKQRPGVVGAGWALSQNYIYRDVNSTPDNTSDDKYILALDGSVYELVFGPDGKWHTEVEYHFKIENLTGNYWLLTKKDGTRYRFGFDEDSLLQSNTGRGYAVKWMLDEVSDTHNNKIYYSYIQNPFPQDNGTIYLDKIEYNNDKKRLVQLSYENSARPDRRAVYDQGNILDESRRLTDLSVFVDGELVRRYRLTYTNLGNSLSSISNITSLGADNSSVLYSVGLSYYFPKQGFDNSTLWKPPVLFSDDSHTDYGVRFADLNRDGFVDILQGREATTEKKVWINNKTGEFVLDNSWNLPQYIAAADGSDYGVRFADINKDGFVDLLRSRAGSRAVYVNNGSGFDSSTWSIPIDFVDGSGVDQGVVLDDVNGDGRADIISSKDGSRSVYLNNGAGWTLTSFSMPVDLMTGGSDSGARLVDVNGDGLPDVLRAKSGTRDAWLNNGTGWVSSGIWTPPTDFVTASRPDNGVRFTDVNGDGLTDLVEDYANGSTTVRGAWINTGDGWEQDTAWQSPEPFTRDGFNIGRRLGDLDGDGFVDLVVSHQDSNAQYSFLKNATTPYLLKSVRNEYGGITAINYSRSSIFNNSEDGVSDIGFNLFVVTNVTLDNSLEDDFGVNSFTSYAYSFGKYDYDKSEFRGFGLAVENKPFSVVEHSFYQDDPRRGKEYKTLVKDHSNKNFYMVLSDYNYTYSSGIYNLSLRSSTSYLYDSSLTPKITNKSYMYDCYGNLLSVLEHGDASMFGDERLTNYSYALNDGYWIMDRVAAVTVFDAVGDKTKETKYYYDKLGLHGVSSTGELSKTEKWNDAGDASFTYYTYDSYGNVLSQTDSLGATTHYNYDLTHTFPSGIINALGHLTSYDYDLGTGNLNWVEKNGIKTHYYYDTFGRISKEVMPYDTISLPTKSYTYSFDGITPESVKVSLKTTADNTNDITYYYDGFANLVQLKSDVEDDWQVVKNLFYDGAFRVGSEQNPYFAAASASLTTASSTANKTFYSYDAVDRVVGVTNPDGSTKNVSFDKWNITDYDENHHKHMYSLDAFGRITHVYEYNINDVGLNETYITNYDYDTNDDLVKITDTLGNVFSFTYDRLGRKTAMDDPDLGRWSYSYDANGNLMSQSGGGGNLVSGDGYYREYDGLGQLVRVRNGSTSSSPLLEEYTYDPDGERIKVQRFDSVNTTIYTPFKELLRIVNSSGSYDYHYIYQDDVLVARLNPDGTKWFYHPDHLGSTSYITDEAGNVIENVSYEPYGKVIASENSESYKIYTGHFSDEQTNQYYFGERYYKPSIGQFISPDPTIQYIYNPQSLNRYGYVLNNPYRYTDPTGLWSLQIGVGASGGLSDLYPGAGAAGGGMAITYDPETGDSEFGFYGTGGIGVLVGSPGGSTGLEISYSPTNKNLDDVSGEDTSVGGEIPLAVAGVPTTFGMGYSYPRQGAGEKTKIDTTKQTVSFYLGVGYKFSLYSFGTTTYTKKVAAIKISDKNKKVADSNSAKKQPMKETSKQTKQQKQKSNQVQKTSLKIRSMVKNVKNSIKKSIKGR
jgi:RHS repeat-associated protein